MDRYSSFMIINFTQNYMGITEILHMKGGYIFLQLKPCSFTLQASQRVTKLTFNR